MSEVAIVIDWINQLLFVKLPYPKTKTTNKRYSYKVPTPNQPCTTSQPNSAKVRVSKLALGCFLPIMATCPPFKFSGNT